MLSILKFRKILQCPFRAFGSREEREERQQKENFPFFPVPTVDVIFLVMHIHLPIMLVMM